MKKIKGSLRGAQGALLDIDYGSTIRDELCTSYGGIFTGAGCPSGKVDEVLGITKAYTTRVGEGHFNELHSQLGEDIQCIGGEFGATTVEKEDVVGLISLLKYSIKAFLTSLALTKLDVLTEVDELKVCTAYEINGEIISEISPGTDLDNATPIYQDLSPFKDDFTVENSKELNEFINLIEKECKTKVSIIAFGPERSQVKFLKNFF